MSKLISALSHIESYFEWHHNRSVPHVDKENYKATPETKFAFETRLTYWNCLIKNDWGLIGINFFYFFDSLMRRDWMINCLQPLFVLALPPSRYLFKKKLLIVYWHMSDTFAWKMDDTEERTRKVECLIGYLRNLNGADAKHNRWKFACWCHEQKKMRIKWTWLLLFVFVSVRFVFFLNSSTKKLNSISCQQVAVLKAFN